MKTRVWSFRNPEFFVEIDHAEEMCCFCVASRHVAFSGPGEVAFLESAVAIHRIECVSVETEVSPLSVECGPTTREAALAEIERHAN